jgi:hypothetical protein
MKNREHRFLTEKHPFINDAEMQIYEHEVALTMNHYVSGNTYGFHANKIEKQETLLFRTSVSADLFRPSSCLVRTILSNHQTCSYCHSLHPSHRRDPNLQQLHSPSPDHAPAWD